jgi:hypothetical protein
MQVDSGGVVQVDKRSRDARGGCGLTAGGDEQDGADGGRLECKRRTRYRQHFATVLPTAVAHGWGATAGTKHEQANCR